ncbi:MAG: hypothetical protein IT359_05520 [Gemmatimonadaceae bacterium]|nr:hypothetical protein [Gemmatimonadaceae bacterium]
MTAHRTAQALAAAATLTLALAAPLQAQRERHAPLLLQLPVTARTMAMGGLTAATRDVESVFGNPALVGGNNAVSLSLGRYASGATTGHLATAMNVGMLGVGVGVALLDAPQHALGPALDSDVLTDEGTLAASNLAATVAASLAWKGFRWGAAARYVESRRGAQRGSSPSFDLGISKNLLSGQLSTGLVLQYLGRDLNDRINTRALPTRIAFGLAGGGKNIGKWIDVGASANIAVREDGEVYPTGGGELSWLPLEGVSLTVWGGARRPELRAQRPLTGGVGVTLDRLSLDYGWEDMRGAGGAHRVTLRLR